MFGLHREAPDRRPDGMGLAWLIRNAVVVTVDADAVAIKTDGGVVQRVARKSGQARLETVVGWELG